MSPGFLAVIFGLLAVVAAWSIMHDLATGAAADDLYRFEVNVNPIGFLAVIGGKIFVVVYGVAMILYACGVIGNPMQVLRTMLGPFA